MKTITIPFLPELDGFPLDDASKVMEENAMRVAVDTLNWPEQFAYKPITSFNIAYSARALYLYFFVRGNCLRAVANTDNGDVYKDSCVEFFVRREEEMKYYNLEFNCIGTAHVGVGEGRHGRTLLPPEELARIQRYTTLPRRPFQEVHGLFSWELMAVVPFDLIGLDKDNLPECIRANVYKCADETVLPHYLSWSEIKTEQPDFHRPEFFGKMIFGER